MDSLKQRVVIMPIKDFLNLSVVSKRKAHIGAKVEGWVDVNTALKCCIFPASPSDVIGFQDTYLRTSISHKMYCLKSEDIKGGDKIISGDDEYLVKRIMDWSHSGIKFYKVYLSEIK